jgi:uncharacterized protein (TIGR03083 family)
MRGDMAGHVAAYEQTTRSVIAVAETLDPADWDRPTECPGWSVRDQVSHIVGVERWLLGEADPEHAVPDLPHVRNDFGRALEVAVDVRRSVPGPKILDELRDALDRRLVALPGIDPDQPTMLPTGRPGTYVELMKFRAFDIWTHEQDIRRAVGRPGNLAAPAAERARDISTSGFPFVVGKRAAAAPGQSVTLEITGQLPGVVHVVVDSGGRAGFADPPPSEPPTVALRLDWETYARLATGRITADAADAAAHVTITGDAVLAGRILAGMALTP